MKDFENMHEYKKEITKHGSPNIKRQLVPDEWKDEIDKMLTRDLLNANRYFAEQNPYIAQHIAEVVRLDPESFFQELVKRWEWHNKYFESILEPALVNMIEERHIAVSPQQVEWLKKAYQISSQIDQATLVTTAAIKKNVEHWMRPEYTGNLDEEERRMILTPPVDSFMAEYECEHLKYLLAKRKGENGWEKKEAELIARYHIGDRRIFDGRMRMWKKDEKSSDATIEERIKKLTLPESYKVNHFYLTVERPRLKAIRDILAFDNREEYFMLKSLIGVSGFILRKRVLQYLNDTKILKNEGNIYEFSDETIVTALEKLKGYRENLMRKKVSGFAQSADTCASAAYMMAMHALVGTPLSQEEELRLHEIARSKGIPGAFFSALAEQGAEQGVAVELLHSEVDMFRQGDLEKGLFERLLREYKEHAKNAEKKGAVVRNGVEFSEDQIKTMLAEDKLPVVAGRIGGFLHAVIIVGYSPDGFIVRDPLNPNPRVWRYGRLSGYMETPIGKWMLVLAKNSEAVEKFLKKASLFEKQAQNYLSTRE